MAFRTKKKDNNIRSSEPQQMHLQGDMPCLQNIVPDPMRQHIIKQNFCIRFAQGPFMGLFYIILGSAFLTSYGLTLKKVTNFSPGLLNFAISACILTCSIPMVVFAQKNMFGPRQHRFLTFLRGLFLELSIYFGIMGYRLLPLLEISIVFSLTPALAVLTARIILKEPCGVSQTLCLVLNLVGVLVSVRVPKLMQSTAEAHFTLEYISGIAYSVAAVISVSFSHLLVRLTKGVHHSVHLMYMGAIGLIFSVCVTLSMSFELPLCGWDHILYLSSGIFMFVGMFFVILALQSEAVAIVVIMRSSCNVVIALILQVIFFSKLPDLYNVFGAILVMISTSAIGISKWLRQLPPEKEHIKKKLKLFLL